tara:strand:+ start:965 stop:1144 length:180 start_codon:yes stop_codon:yes gene_type:complete
MKTIIKILILLIIPGVILAILGAILEIEVLFAIGAGVFLLSPLTILILIAYKATIELFE